MKKDIKSELVELITKKIETDKVLPWSIGLLNKVYTPINGKTGRPYRGINYLLLNYFGSGSMEFMTFNQIKEAGGKVKKGSKSFPIIFWSVYNKAEKRPAQAGDDEDDIYGFWKKYNVFEVGEQTEGIEPKREYNTKENEHNIDVESFVKTFAEKTGLTINIKNRNGVACYRPADHSVNIAPVEEYESTNAWAATLLHECVHSTARAMKRTLIGGFGSEKYSKEEVIAEFGAALLCREFGITTEDDNTAAYLQSWSKKLKENPDWLISGANQAQKAVDYMLKMAGMAAETEGEQEAA